MQPTYPAVNVLRKGDVIMKVDGIRVANDGSIPFRAGERVALKYYMSQLFPEDKVGTAAGALSKDGGPVLLQCKEGENSVA